jgi:YVTN family beta-propeller protein
VKGRGKVRRVVRYSRDEHRSCRGWRAALCGSTALAAASLTLIPGARAQSGPFAYVTNQSDSTVSRIDIPTSTIAAGTIPVGPFPGGAAVRGDQSLVYVANQGTGTVSVIDTATNTVTATIAGLGSNPFATAISPDGARVYVANQVQQHRLGDQHRHQHGHCNDRSRE